MIDHVSIGVAQLPRAVAFYDAVLAPLGYARLWMTERAAGYGVAGRDEPLALHAVGDEVRAPGAGCHLALVAPTPAAVDAFHRAALGMGAVDEGAPGPRPRYGNGYYAAFVRDLDGYKIEAVCHQGDPRCR